MTVHRSMYPRRGVTRPGAGLGAPAAKLNGWHALFGAVVLAGAPGTLNAQCQPAWSPLLDLDYGYVADITDARSWPGGRSVITLSGGFLPPSATAQFWLVEWDGWRWNPFEGVGGNLSEILAVRTAFHAQSMHPLNGLYAGGHFGVPGPIGANIARWASGEWSLPGGGLTSGTPSAIKATDSEGPGTPAVYIGGGFLGVGGISANSVARWDGFVWSALGSGIAGNVYDFEVYDDDGPGPRVPGLYVVGSFQSAGGIPALHIARWDGAAWEALGSGLSGTPTESLKAFDADGPGPQREMLYVGGTFNSAGGVPGTVGLARWDGTAWSAVPGWFGAANVKAMEVFDDDGPGPHKNALFVAGIMPPANIYRWDGAVWTPLPGGVTGGTGFPFVNALCVFDEDGPGPNPGGLYIGGNFDTAGGIATRGIARWGCPLPPRCDANCSGDFHPVTGQHVLTITDFACFQTRYVLGDESADCNEDGGLTIADFGCFQTKFVAGCP